MNRMSRMSRSPLLAAFAAAAVLAGEADQTLRDTAAALQKTLGQPLQLEVRKDAEQRVLVAKLLPQADAAAPWEQQDLFVPLFRIGCAATRRALDVDHVQVRSADPLAQTVWLETSLASVRRYYDKQISAEEFKKAATYRVQRKDFTADELYRQALATGDNEAETELLRKAVAKDPQHLPACALLGFKLFNSGAEDALTHLLAARKLAPKALEVSWFVASAYRNASAWERMLSEIAACEALAAGDGELLVPRLNLPEARARQLSEAWTKSFILKELSQYKCIYFIDAKRAEAQPALEAYLKTWPEDATGHRLMGIFRIVQEDAGKALRSFEKSAALDPNCASTWRLLGIAYGEKKKYREEALAMRRAIALGDHRADNYVKLGFAYAQLDEWYDCKNVSAEGLKRHPQEDSLRRNFKEGHKVILLRNLKPQHPPYPMSAPLDLAETDLSKP